MKNIIILIGLSLAVLITVKIFHFGTDFLLYQAAENGDTRIAVSMLKLGADPNTTDGEFGITALMAAAQNGHSEIVSALIEKHADVNALNEHGLTAFQIANNFNQPKIASIIQRAGRH